MPTTNKHTHDPKAGARYNGRDGILTLRDGSTVCLSTIDGDKPFPYTFLEACGWHDALRRGQPLPPLDPAAVLRRAIRRKLESFSVDALKKALALIEEVDEQDCSAHWRKRDAQMYATH